MVEILCQQYNFGEKPTVIVYTYVNRHAGTLTLIAIQNKDKTHDEPELQFFCNIGSRIG